MAPLYGHDGPRRAVRTLKGVVEVCSGRRCGSWEFLMRPGDAGQGGEGQVPNMYLFVSYRFVRARISSVAPAADRVKPLRGKVARNDGCGISRGSPSSGSELRCESMGAGRSVPPLSSLYFALTRAHPLFPRRFFFSSRASDFASACAQSRFFFRGHSRSRGPRGHLSFHRMGWWRSALRGTGFLAPLH